MKKEVLVVILFICMNAAHAEFYFENDAYIDINISSHFTLVPIDPDFQMDVAGIDLNLSVFPRTSTRQQVFDVQTYPKSVQVEGKLLFSWYAPDGTSFEFGLDSLVHNRNVPVQVGEVRYEIQETTYTACVGRIDCNSTEIFRTAQSLVAGEDDLFSISHKVANYVHNLIDYNIYYIGQDSATEILKNKKGVCQEFSTLYAALMRSLGISTKYVYGLVYSEDVGEFVPHNWNEVYFPEFGWIPFDPTLAQYGAIDTSHIKLRDYIDADESIADFDIDGYNVRLIRNKIEKVGKLRNSRKIEPASLDIELDILKEKVGLGSYNLLKLKLHNPNDYFFASRLDILLPEKVMITDQISSVSLAPAQTKVIYQLLKLDDEMDDGYTYNFSVDVRDRAGAGDSIEFLASSDYLNYTEKQIYLSLSEENEQDRRGYSEEMILDCIKPDIKHYQFETMVINCTVSNDGGINVKGLNFCNFLTCETFDLNSGESIDLNSTVYFIDVGQQEQKIYIDHPKVYKIFYVPLDVSDAPIINITSLKYPLSVDYGDTFKIEFRLNKVSESDPSNLVIDFNSDKVWRFFDFPQSKTFTFDYEGSDLKPGVNEIELEITYTDDNGNDYHRDEMLRIRVDNVPFWNRIIPVVNDDASNIFLVVLVFIFVFIAILMIIFRPSKSTEDFKDYASARFELAEDDISQLRHEVKDLRKEKKDLESKLTKMEDYMSKVYEFMKGK